MRESRVVVPIVRGLTLLSLIGGSVVVAPGVSTAAVPSNDTRAAATAISELPFATSVDLSDATSDAEEVALATACGRNLGPGVWFSYTPGTDYQQRILSPASRGVFSGTIARVGADGVLVPVSCEGSSKSALLESGVTYYVLFSGRGGFGIIDATCRPEPGDPVAVGGIPPCPPSMRAAPGASVGVHRAAGAVVLRFRSSAYTFLPRTRVLTQGGEVGDAVETGDRFGAAVAQGLVDGDGFQDVVIGAPGEDVDGSSDAGSVHVIFGSARGIGLGRPAITLQQRRSQPMLDTNRDSHDGPELGDTFGAALSISDKGHVLAVGVPGEDVAGRRDAGEVVLYRFRGDADPPEEQVLDQRQLAAGPVEQGNRFGTAVAWNEAYPQGSPSLPQLTLLVGAPGDDVGGRADAGSVFTLSSWAGIKQRLDQASAGVPGQPEEGDQFGASLITIGGPESESDIGVVAIGVPGEDRGRVRNTGQVVLLSGTHVSSGVSGCSRTVGQRGSATPRSTSAGDRFGSVLAVRNVDAIPFVYVGTRQLLVGVPRRDVDGRRDAGAVYVVPLSGTCGEALRPLQVINQAAPGIAGVPEVGDRFGAALGTVSVRRQNVLDGDEYTDLVLVGAPGEDLRRHTDAGIVQQILPVGATDRGQGPPSTGSRYGLALG
jgi:hypothetical protein